MTGMGTFPVRALARKPAPKIVPQGPLLLVLPFYSGDAWLLEKNLKWMKELDGKQDFDCLLACDDQTSPNPIVPLAQQAFRSVKVMQFKRLQKTEWPIPQNHAWTSVAWAVEKMNRPWFWMEPDAVPVHEGWLREIAAAHAEGKKPFTGYWGEANKVFNGVGVYPPSVIKYSQKALQATMIFDPKGRQNPWDVYCSKEVEPHLNKCDLFMHRWNDELSGKPFTFPTIESARVVIPKRVAVFHRCKDASLVMRLHEQNQKGYSKDLRWTI